MTLSPAYAEEARKIAEGLSEAQRKFLRNASKRPKSPMTVRRHAKLSPFQRVFSRAFRQCFEPDAGVMCALSPLGLAVRAILQEQNNAG